LVIKKESVAMHGNMNVKFIIEAAYLGGALLAFVGGGKNVELCAFGRKRTLVDIDSAQVDIDTTRSPGRSETKTLVTQPTIIRIKM
jgi:hypothetical protein